MLQHLGAIRLGRRGQLHRKKHPVMQMPVAKDNSALRNQAFLRLASMSKPATMERPVPTPSKQQKRRPEGLLQNLAIILNSSTLLGKRMNPALQFFAAPASAASIGTRFGNSRARLTSNAGIPASIKLQFRNRMSSRIFRNIRPGPVRQDAYFLQMPARRQLMVFDFL